MMKKLLDKTFLRFIIVGVINTIFGTTVMFVAYNAFHLSYWVSSALNYILGSILSFFLNKHFTFKNHSRSIKVVVRFVVNIVVCYFVAYGAAKPLVAYMLSGAGKSLQENVAMFAGMCIFVVLNYLGQRFFAFREREDEK